MSLDAVKLNISATINDYKRDRKIPFPSDITQFRNIPYGNNGKWNLLDVYFPNGTSTPLPTIVNIHGGGFVYGTKEIYRRYCMYLAKQGFTVVNFNYRLAPSWKFPTPLLDTNSVMEWIVKYAEAFFMDTDRIFLVGDSAGAQLASQYAAIVTNLGYANLLGITVPAVHIRGLCLNCGLYDMPDSCGAAPSGIMKDYLGADADRADPRLDVLGAITSAYPPAYITTAYNDFLFEAAEPMYNHLISKGLDAQWKCYGTKEQEEVGHVFHINIIHPEAIKCNTDTCEFFRKYL